MKIYTKTGDEGMTGLYGGTRVSKSDLRIESYGMVDELNSYLGLIRDQKLDTKTSESIIKIQKELFTVGAVLATPVEKTILKNGKKRLGDTKVTEEMILFLENEMDLMNEDLPAMTHFVLPGGHTTVSYCHIARCVCRKAERMVVTLSSETVLEPTVLKYLNRLSDYLFVLARKLSFDNNANEIKWIP
jgi:cob(I)alamin adenosyltransferase